MKMNLVRSTFCLAFLFALGIISTSHRACSAGPPKRKTAPPYTITRLGTLHGGSSSFSRGMNNRSDVVGQSETGIRWSFFDNVKKAEITGFWHHAFLNVKNADGTRFMIDLHDQFEINGLIPQPVLAPDPIYGWNVGWFVNAAIDINDNGQIIGGMSYVSAVPDGFDPDGVQLFKPQVTDGMIFRYTPDNPAIGEATLDDLGNDPKGLGKINDHGDIVAYGTGADGNSHPYVWKDATKKWVELPLFQNYSTLALDINDSGQVCGPNNYMYRAWRYTPGIGYADLGSLFKGNSAYSGSFSINNNGQVAGDSVGASSRLAFRYTNGQGMKSLGTLGGTNSTCDSYGGCINSSGDVIGYSDTSDGQQHIFLYTDALGMVDLETAVTNLPANLVGLLGRQLNLNDSGHVCGSAGDGTGSQSFLGGHTYEAYVLIPTL